ncbi:MAG: hypothetical protein LBU34_03545 [Planctomycetaceae bacterium]|jgi:hypothetical protein|nr:hypothetical protein [Planctomycetaceae bacterium]
MIQYLAYDIKGIQQFIFSVPKLKYIVGASLLIAEFDDWAADSHKKEVLFTGGGRGIFHSENKNKINKIKSALIAKSKEFGLDLRLGIAGSFSEVVHCANDFYAFVPDLLDGEPDAVSGMLPTTHEKRIHPIIEQRRNIIGQIGSVHSFDQKNLKNILGKLPQDIQNFKEKGGQVEFLSNVNPEEVDDRGTKGSKALGDRNRWAIVCLDGNDMGAQFRTYEKKYEKGSDKEKTDWYQKMSQQLNCCTKNAFYEAAAKIINNWYGENRNTISLQENLLVLPFRPLILGGDDVTAIVHSAYALDFAKILIEKFNDLSKQHKELWVGTNGELTISAGIAYTNVSLPLHTSLPYAESLLGNAKRKFRNDKKDGEATPAAIDWEHITESMLDTPTARRNRDSVFYDNDISTKIVLTERPYNFESLDELLKLKAELQTVPRSLLAECQTILTLPWAKRIQRLAALKKQNNKIFEKLKEENFDGKLGSAWTEKTIDKPNDNYPNLKTERTTKFLDAVSLLEEDHRLTQNTTEDN